MLDKQGREYAHLKDIKVGRYIVVDGSFSCMASGSRKKVFRDNDNKGFYVLCSHGRHYLDGQCGETDDLIGMYQEDMNVQL